MLAAVPLLTGAAWSIVPEPSACDWFNRPGIWAWAAADSAATRQQAVTVGRICLVVIVVSPLQSPLYHAERWSLIARSCHNRPERT